MMQDDQRFLKLAIAKSRESMQAGNFPAGAVVVRDGEVLTTGTSDPFPNLLHSDSKAVIQAFTQFGPLTNASLYVGIESCLMCTSVAYWAGIRRVVYAVSRDQVSADYYETPTDPRPIIDTFHSPIEFIHLKELQIEALAVIHEWEVIQDLNNNERH